MDHDLANSRCLVFVSVKGCLRATLPTCLLVWRCELYYMDFMYFSFGLGDPKAQPIVKL